MTKAETELQNELQFKIIMGDVVGVQRWLDRGAKVNRPDKNHTYPIDASLSEVLDGKRRQAENLTVLSLLLDNSSNLDAKGNGVYSNYRRIFENFNKDAFNLWIKKVNVNYDREIIDICHPNTSEQKAMFLHTYNNTSTVDYGNLHNSMLYSDGGKQMIQFLIEKKTIKDVNALDREGKNLLMSALLHNASNVVIEGLLDMGVSLNIVAKNGKTVYDYDEKGILKGYLATKVALTKMGKFKDLLDI